VETQDYQRGVAYPSVFVLDEGGRVLQKRIHENYRARESALMLLEDGLGLGQPGSRALLSASSPRVRIGVFADSERYFPWQRTRLHVELVVDAGWHLYSRPISGGYAPLTIEVKPLRDVAVGEPNYPPARPFKMDGLDEEFYVLDGPIRVSVPIAVNAAAGLGDITIRVLVRYQACSPADCLPPSEVQLEITLQEATAG
jgi:DsbC/DsbD-like thiol-disulfide interchange protein